MADDPMDAFDKFADDIRRTQDELDAADKLRAEKATDRKKQKTDEPAGDVGAPGSKPPEGR